MIIRRVVRLLLIRDKVRARLREGNRNCRCPERVVGILPAPQDSSGASDSRTPGSMSCRPPSENPVTRPLPSSNTIAAMARSSSARCAMHIRVRAEHALLLPLNRMNRIERRGRSPVRWMSRAASITSAALQPLSSAPVPSSQESRCAPSTTNSSGFSRPRISATTFSCSAGPPIWLGSSRRTRTFSSAAR